MPRLMQMLVYKHAKHDWRYGCDCDFCKRKRVITNELDIWNWYDRDDGDWTYYANLRSKRYWNRVELRKTRQDAVDFFTTA